MSLNSIHLEPKLPLGRYRHYKGPEYEVIAVARDSETEEPFVVYRCLYGDRSVWIRSLSNFVESIEMGGESLPRFAFIGEPGTQTESQ